MSDSPLGDGAQLTTAVFGVPVGGLIQVWTDKPTVWHLSDPGSFTDIVGSGLIARTQIRPGRYREECLFDEESGTVVLESRHGAAQPESESQVGGRIFTAAPPSEVFGDPWEDLNVAIFRAAAQAFARHELIVVEPGGWDDSDGRFCLIVAVHDDGADQIILETSPAPTGSELWPPTDQSDHQTISAPASEDALRGAGALAVEAISRWGVAPWDVTITYVVPSEAFGD